MMHTFTTIASTVTAAAAAALLFSSSSPAAAIVVLPRQGGGGPKVLAGAPTGNITVTASQLVECSTSSITWTGGSPPYTLEIATGGYYLPTQEIRTDQGLSEAKDEWVVTEKEGTGMFFQVTDAMGEVGEFFWLQKKCKSRKRAAIAERIQY